MNLSGLERLQRGQVWCVECGSTHKVNVAACAGKGWPVCCGYTMTIDSPEERGADRAKAAYDKEVRDDR